jgi:hypothetical protein
MEMGAARRLKTSQVVVWVHKAPLRGRDTRCYSVLLGIVACSYPCASIQQSTSMVNSSTSGIKCAIDSPCNKAVIAFPSLPRECPASS